MLALEGCQQLPFRFFSAELFQSRYFFRDIPLLVSLFFVTLSPKKVFLNNSVMEQNQLKEVPYGVSDFDVVRRDNLYYVDKTMYLPKLESQARNLFFIRPRRFGKS